MESIVKPDAHVVASFDGGLMPANAGQQLSAQELADLVAFLVTPEDE